MLLSAGLSRDRVSHLAAELSARVRLTRFEALLTNNGLDVLGPIRLRAAGLDELAKTVERDLAPTIAASRVTATVLEVMTGSLLDRLEVAGIPAVALKGVFLSRRLYDDPAARRSGDIDLLVPAQSLDDAVLLVREAYGYDAPLDAVDQQGRPVLHFGLRHPGGWPNIEIHWRTHWYEERSGEVMLSRSTIVEGVRYLAPADECATLLLYYARDGFLGLRTIGSAAAWWDRFGNLIGPGGLLTFAEEFPELRPALVAAATLGEALLGLPLSQLGLPAARERGELRAIRLADVEPRRLRAQLQAQIWAVDLMLAPSGSRMAAMRRQKQINDSLPGPRCDASGNGIVAKLNLASRAVRRAARMLAAMLRTGPWAQP